MNSNSYLQEVVGLVQWRSQWGVSGVKPPIGLGKKKCLM